MFRQNCPSQLDFSSPWTKAKLKLEEIETLNTFYGNVQCKAKRNSRLGPPCWLVFSLINAEMASARDGMCHFAVLELNQERDEGDWEHQSSSSTGKLFACSEHTQLKPYSTKIRWGENNSWKMSNIKLKKSCLFSCPALCIWWCKAAAPCCVAKHSEI